MKETIENDLEILGIYEDKWYEVKDYSDYVDFHMNKTSNNKYDLYIIKSNYPLKGNGMYISSNTQSMSMDDYIEYMINNIKNKYNINNIIWKELKEHE